MSATHLIICAIYQYIMKHRRVVWLGTPCVASWIVSRSAFATLNRNVTAPPHPRASATPSVKHTELIGRTPFLRLLVVEAQTGCPGIDMRGRRGREFVFSTNQRSDNARHRFRDVPPELV